MISEASSRILQAAIDRGCLGLEADHTGEYRCAYFRGTDDELKALCEVRSLIKLDCMESSITDESFGHVANLPTIRVLNVSFTGVTGRTFQVIQTLPCLEEFHCNPQEDTSLAALAIARCPKLRIINIAAGHFTAEEAQLLFLPTLEKFNCELSARLTDEAFANVRSSPRLIRIGATDFPIGDLACEYLSRSESIRSLNLGATKITDGGVATLSRIASLQELKLDGTSISAAAIRWLVGLPSLTELSIDECPIGDEALDYFAALPALHTLWVDDTRFTKSGLRKLYAQRKWEYFSPRP